MTQRSTSSLRSTLRSGRRLLGTLVTVGTGSAAEALSLSGWDWLFIDLEHSQLDVADAQRILQAMADRCHGVIRVADQTETAIKKALDTGCDGIIVPQVNDAEQARDVVRAARYGPLGTRSVGVSRAHGYGTDFVGYVARANDDIAVIVQAEHVDAVNNIDGILSVEGIDAVFIGPYDLSASLGRIGQVTDESVRTAIATVQQACRDHGVPWGIFGMTAASVTQSVAAGATLVAIGSDISMIVAGSKAAQKEMGPNDLQVQFRRFVDTDEPTVAGLHKAALESTDAFITVDGYYADLEDIRGHYLDSGGEFLVGELGGVLVAMGGFEVHSGKVAEIRRMRVAPNLQGRGIGRDLLCRLEAAAVERHCERINLDTTVNQKAAQHLFTSSAYVETSRGNKGGDLESIFFVKVLAQPGRDFG